jgi:hypothetical protein
MSTDSLNEEPIIDPEENPTIDPEEEPLLEELKINIPSPSFDNAFQTSTHETKLTITRAIKANSTFSCQLIDICEMLHYPKDEEVNSWMKKTLGETLVPKPLNEKALASRKAKGLTTSKNPRELLLVLVSGTDTRVHIGISIPELMMDTYGLSDFVENIVGEEKYDVETIKDSVGSFTIVSFEHEFPFKQRDVVLQNSFNVLKVKQIYVDDEEDVIYDI